MKVKQQSKNTAGRRPGRVWGSLLFCGWMSLLGASVFGAASPEQVLIPDETFTMGNSFTNLYPSEGWASELPPHEVPVGPFFIGRFEITNEEMAEALQWAYTNGLVELDQTIITNVTEVVTNTMTNTVTNFVTHMYGTVRNTEGIPYELMDLDSEYPQILFTNGAFTVVSGKTNFPCIEVTWYGALAFCNYLSDQEGLSRAVDFSVTNWSVNIKQDGYRLPTEAEWEKACRGGTPGTHYPWPDDSLQGTNLYAYSIDPRKANYWDGWYGIYNLTNHPGHPWFGEPIRTTPVGYYNGSQVITNWSTNRPYRGADFGVIEDMANGFGLYDMAGNVYEWCTDYLSTNWYSQSEAVWPDPKGPAADASFVSGAARTQCVVRGGGWTTYSVLQAPDPSFQRCSFRASFPATYAAGFIGFRTARRFQLANPSITGDQFSMTYGGVSGEVYTVKSTTNLTEAWPWTMLTQVTNGGTGTEEIQLDLDGDKRLFLLQATP